MRATRSRPGIQPAVGDIASGSFSKADYITSYAVFHIWGLGGCCPLTHNHGGCDTCSLSPLLPCNGYPLHKAYYSMGQDYDIEPLEIPRAFDIHNYLRPAGLHPDRR
jgi:hypothetical protein